MWAGSATSGWCSTTPIGCWRLLEQREAARKGKDFATADAIRDRIKAAGIEIEDTPSGPAWSLAGSDD